MQASHGVVCAGATAEGVMERLDDSGVSVEYVPSIDDAVERARGTAGVVLVVDAETDPGAVERVATDANAEAVVVAVDADAVADGVDPALASVAVDADVSALCTTDEAPERIADELGIEDHPRRSAVADDASDEMPVADDASDEMPVDDVDDRGGGPWRGAVVDRLFETSPDRLVVFESDGTVVRANDRAREEFQVSIGESSTGDADVYDTDGEYVPADDRPWATVFQSGEATYGHQYEVDPDDAEASWYVVDVVPLGDRPDAAFASFRDVTDEERARERLEERTDELVAELDETLERVTDAFFALDDEYRFTYVNDTAADLIDVDPERVRGESIWDAFPAAVGTTFEDKYRRAMTEQESVTFEEYFPPLSTWFAVRAYPSESGLSVYFQDVTDRKNRERALNERLAQQEVVSELSHEAIERADVDGFLRRATERIAETLSADGARLLEYGEDGPEGVARVRSSVGWFDAVEGTVDDDASSVTARSGSVVTAEVGGAEEAWGELVVVAEATDAFSAHDRRFVRSVANVVASAIDRKRRERTLATKDERLAALDQLSRVVRDINRELSGYSSREELERVVCERLANASSYEFAWVGDVDDDGDVSVRTEAGVEGVLADRELSLDDADASIPATTALRDEELSATQDVRVDHVTDEWREHAATHGFRSSVAVPLVHEDETYGVLSIYADRPHAFDGRERRVVEQLGEVVGLAIALAERDRELREREREYRTLAENVPNATVTMFDADGAYVTVAGSLYDRVLDVDDDALVGQRPADVRALPEDVRASLSDAHAGALAGEQVECEVEVDANTLVVRAIPVRDDGSITGGIALAQDVTARRERRAQLEHERERLEYVNRLLRHNLLNSLNVVHARTNLLEGKVDADAQTHLETAASRLDEMIDFVETMRSLMHILLDDANDCEPIALDDVLVDEVEKVEGAYDVPVNAEELPSIAVAADELLPEVFENLLVNAVQHNDAADPEVFVDVDVEDAPDDGTDGYSDAPDDATGDAPDDATGVATVYVSDNGSGVDPDMRDGLFQKGKKGFDSPGTGFGLYLVRETVDAYGGDVALVDDDHSGATFAVTLPLADDDTA